MKLEGERIKNQENAGEIDLFDNVRDLEDVRAINENSYERYLANKVFWKEVKSKLKGWKDL